MFTKDEDENQEKLETEEQKIKYEMKKHSVFLPTRTSTLKDR